MQGGGVVGRDGGGAQDRAAASLHCAGLRVSEGAQSQCRGAWMWALRAWPVLEGAEGWAGSSEAIARGGRFSHSLLPTSPLQMAATIDMNFQSDLLSIFEENLF